MRDKRLGDRDVVDAVGDIVSVVLVMEGILVIGEVWAFVVRSLGEWV